MPISETYPVIFILVPSLSLSAHPERRTRMSRQIHCYGSRFAALPSSPLHRLSCTRKLVDIIQVTKDDAIKSNVKRAFLSAKKRERIKLPFYGDAYEGKEIHISDFFNHPTGVEAMLNVNALESYVSLGENMYRCKIPPIQLLKFEVAPVLDLLVNPTNEGCTVELLSCKFEGSELVESQNQYFSANMRNNITWDISGSESFLDIDVKLDISLQIYNRPFVMLPVSAVEGPGNLVVQALLDRASFFELYMMDLGLTSISTRKQAALSYMMDLGVTSISTRKQAALSIYSFG